MPARFFQAGNLEGNMRYISNGQFLGPVAAGLYLGSPSRLGFTNQVNLSASLTEPGTREVKIARAGNFLHVKHLAVKTAGALNIFDDQSRVIQSANLHRRILLS